MGNAWGKGFGARFARLPRWAWLVSAGVLLLGLFVWRPWGGARSVAGRVIDHLGVRNVEGHAEIIRAAAEESGVDPYLLGAIMFVESRGRGGQRSSADALGLMQLRMPSVGDAAARLGIETPNEEQVLEDNALNVRLGASHVAWLLEHRGQWNDEQVLVSYNAGRARLFRWIEEADGYSAWVRQQERKLEGGERTNGALSYARHVLEMERYLRSRGALGD